MSTLYWSVPVHLDALFLQQDQAVPGPMADFSRMPWTDGTRDYNSSVPFTSEELLTKPFEDSGFILKAGVHLHWALPDSLTRIAIATDGTGTYPAVPDRWVIARSVNGVSDYQWIVESTYLFSVEDGPSSGAITMPQPLVADQQPFRYMGRDLPLSAWTQGAPDDYADNVTAVGYGEPTFAAFYPNCHSVFGFHDGTADADTVANKLSYTIIGYYANPENDYYGQFITDFIANNNNPTNEQLLDAINGFFQWTTSDVSDGIPNLMLCYATINFAPDSNDNIDLTALANAAQVTMGQTGAEALSARLAYGIAEAQYGADFKDLMEDQLEALQMADFLGSKQLDIGANFRETRHTNGFSAQQSGVTWSIVNNNDMTQAGAVESQEAASILLPEEMGDVLNLLNTLQEQFDNAWWKLVGRQRQLFTDWYKYQQSEHPPQDQPQSYPSPSLIRWYLSQRSIPSIAQLYNTTGEVTYAYDDDGNITGASTSDIPATLAWQLVTAINNLISQLSQFNATTPVTETGVEYTLQGHGTPRYWVANDPVLLVNGDIAEPTDRHGQDYIAVPGGLLPCQVATVDTSIIDNSTGTNVINTGLLAAIADWVEQERALGIETWTAQPWNPFMMEWLVEMQPLQNGSNSANPSMQYSTDFITSNFVLPENSPDLVSILQPQATMPGGLFYSGRSILSAGPGDLLVGKLYAALMLDIMPGYFSANKITPSATYLFEDTNILLVITWYAGITFTPETTDAEKAADPDYTMLLSWQEVLDMHYLSQSLDGFTAGLLQTKTTLQLVVADPTGFTDEQQFATMISGVVGPENTHAPLALNDFSPVRNGNLRVAALNLIDTFGQVAQLPVTSLVFSEPLEENYPGTSDTLAYLAPRLAQPARLHLRWLSAKNDIQEMNDLPASNPVCGWMVPNLFSSSLAFYDSNGQALGSIDINAQWQPAPGSEAAIYYLPNIGDPHLRKVIDWLLNPERGTGFIGAYLEAVENGLNNIQPETYAQNGTLALLAGQPLAIVRTKLSLQLMGDPAIDQSWLSFRQDLGRANRNTAMSEYIQFPVRLGEYEQMNDGLIGYWIEDDKKFAGNLFYAPQSDTGNANPHILTHGESTFTIDLAPADAPVHLTMLFDPRGKLHATSGILPVKEIDIPPAYYSAALQRMEISFLTAPLLTDGQNVTIPTPSVAGYSWSWVQRQSLDWQEITELSPVSSSATFTTTQALLEGWMKLKATDLGIITPPDND